VSRKKSTVRPNSNGSGSRSRLVAIARRLGFLTDTTAARADELCAANPESSSTDILIDAGLLTERDARVVEAECLIVDPELHLEEKFHRADRAIRDAQTSANRVLDLATRKGS
jgi:hypothetical protein